jgi:uncharacterized iron-regulated protein
MVPTRVVESRTVETIDLETLAGRVASAEVVLFGEFHDDPGTHQLQLALLEALARRRHQVLLSLEMFERDVQPVLDAYLAGEITEETFLARSRPWSNYATDYRPLVEFARAQHWPVLAANVPRRLAAQVGRGGLDTLSALPGEERSFAAAEIGCPHDRYHQRFVETMGDHPGMDEAMIDRFYKAQCLKDETMAEAIVDAIERYPGALVVHMNGSFHSDYGDGVPARIVRRRPGTRVTILTGIPVPELEHAPVTENLERADYLLFTKEPRKR